MCCLNDSVPLILRQYTGKLEMYSLETLTRKFNKNKNVILFIIFVGYTCIAFYYMTARNILIGEPVIMQLEAADDSLSCHYVEEGDALPAVEDSSFSPEPNSIFFHETSCRGGLTSRQACSIESASRAHPKRQIYVIFSGPVSELVYERSCIAKLRQFPNVRFARLHINEYAKNTPLEAILSSKSFQESKFRVVHTSDMLRILTLYKWGGLYLDMDMLVIKSLTTLGDNWAAWEEKNSVCGAAIAISMDIPGRKFVGAIINELSTDYRPDEWAYNGPRAITRALRKMCNATDWSTNTCEGIDLYRPEYIYPIHFNNYNEYLEPGPLKNVEKAYTYHLWSHFYHDQKIKKDSAYVEIARKLCPTIYEMYGDDFGS